jgi:hypothetical protein
MKKIFKFSLLALIAIFSASITYAQEWTKTQQELWKVVEGEWSTWAAGDIAGMTSILHEKYRGWNSDSPLPMTKPMTIKYFNDMKDMYKVNFHGLNPARIAVTDNSAVVDYFYSYSISFGEGDKKKTEEAKGRLVEFYTKEGGKWQLLGDMMVDDEDDDEEDD